jgi:predicted DNA-binding transcriptional regulator YafY
METTLALAVDVASPVAPKRDVSQRLAMLEATALWEGRVTTNVLVDCFGISRGQASKDFSLYQRLAPANLAYDLSQKAYFPTNSFIPRFISGSADEYLQLVQAGAVLGESIVLPIQPTSVGIALVQPPARRIDPDVLRAVHQAIRNRRKLLVSYQSMSSAMRELVLEPHTLVFNGFRWHVRAYSHQHDEYRDFVLARFTTTPVLQGKGRNDPGADTEWQEWETLCIKPNPALSASQQEVIADDYGMMDGALLLTVRKALSFYYLRMLGLDDGDGKEAHKRQLVLAGRHPRNAGHTVALSHSDAKS